MGSKVAYVYIRFNCLALCPSPSSELKGTTQEHLKAAFEKFVSSTVVSPSWWALLRITSLIGRTSFNCVVKSLHFWVLNVNCIFNNCLLAYAYIVYVYGYM